MAYLQLPINLGEQWSEIIRARLVEANNESFLCFNKAAARNLISNCSVEFGGPKVGVSQGPPRLIVVVNVAWSD